MRRHHTIDVNPVPEDKKPIFINEAALIDESIADYADNRQGDLEINDNVRVYVPLDLNADAIIRRLNAIVASYGEANEENELYYSIDVGKLISQIEIYDQIWSARKGTADGKHRNEAVALVERFVSVLEDIPDGCAEMFPFDYIEELNSEYLH